jgi:hypothetical protein
MNEYQRTDSACRTFRSQRAHDIIGGAVLIAVAVLALWISRDLPGGQGFSLGPGTAPTLVAWFLLVCGGGIAVSGFRGEASAPPTYSVRGPFFILAAIGVFACSIDLLGLMLASYLTFMIASFASAKARLLEILVVGAGLTLFCSLLFSFGLHLPFDLWPAFIR